MLGGGRRRQAVGPAPRQPEGDVARERKAPATLLDLEEGNRHAASRNRLAHRCSRRETERATKRCPAEHRPVPLVKAPLNFLSQLVFAVDFHCSVFVWRARCCPVTHPM